MANKSMCAGSGASMSDVDLLTHIRELEDHDGSGSKVHAVANDVDIYGAEPSTSMEDGSDHGQPDDFVARIRAEVAVQDQDEELMEADRILEEAKRRNDEFIRKTISDAVHRVESSTGSRLRRNYRQPSSPSEIGNGKENIDISSPQPSSPGSSERTEDYTRAMADLEMSDEHNSAVEDGSDEEYVPEDNGADGNKEKICFACGKAVLVKNYQRHVERAHLQKKELKCTLCNRKFLRVHHLKRHMTTHENPKFNCIHCNMGFADPGALVIHKGRIHKMTSEDKPISYSDMHKCKRCLKLYKTEEELKRHDYYCKNAKKIKEKRAEIRETKLACSPAMSTISYTSNASSPGTPSRPKLDSRCPLCNLHFASRQSMLRHVQRKHPDKYEEASQTRIYKNDEVLAFPCSVCGKSFAKEEALANHYRRHFTTQTHKCTHPGCDKSYLQPSELRKHAKRKHGIDV
uniref:C2H2-type domain-containing protein n=1 Tax=Steinernema glaseri TaxID=37863 RepID=A0A1I7ZT70_9BILA